MLMREYETMYILRPDLSDDEIGQVNEKLDGVLDREGAKKLRIEAWGKRKLAYEIDKQPKGIYFILHFLAQSGVVKELERNLKIMDPVLKYQTVKIAENVDVDRRISEQQAEDQARAAQEAQKLAEAASAVISEPTHEHVEDFEGDEYHSSEDLSEGEETEVAEEGEFKSANDPEEK